MNKYMGIIISLIVLFLILGCEDEKLSPSNADINFFEVADEDTSLTAEMRRSFFRETGCYLLFDATLTKNGFRRVLNVNYGVTKEGKEFYDSEIVRYIYLDNDTDKKEAVEFIKAKLLPYVHKKELPYSLLLVDTILLYSYDKKLLTYNMDNPNKSKTLLQGLSATVIAYMKGVADKAEKEQCRIQQDILSSIIKKSLGKVAEGRFSTFYSYSLPYYDKSYEEGDPEMPQVNDLKELGFLKAFSFKPGKKMSFYAQGKDKEVFIAEVLSSHDSVWRSKYSTYPLVLAKLDELKSLIESLGYSLEYLKE